MEIWVILKFFFSICSNCSPELRSDKIMLFVRLIHVIFQILKYRGRGTTSLFAPFNPKYPGSGKAKRDIKVSKMTSLEHIIQFQNIF